MNFDVICVGKLKEKYLKDAMDEYLKRLSRFGKVNVYEVSDEAADDTGLYEKAMEKEMEKIEKHIKDNTYLVTLCIEGKMLDSVEFAEKIKSLSVSGTSHITFVIGGSYGIDERLKRKSDLKLSFSKMTFPHQLMRVFLLEQIYRACKINANENYHK